VNLTEYKERKREEYLAWKRKAFSLVDSGANEHMVNDLSYLIDYVPYNQSTLTNRVWITVGDGDQVEALGTGTLVLEGPEHQVVLREVLYVPDLYTNVLSVSKLTETDNLAVVFTKSEGIVKPYEGSSRVLLRAKKCDGLYLIDMSRSKVSVCMHVSNANEHVSCFSGSASPGCELSVLWHNRLGHPSQQMTRKLTMSDTVCGLPSFETLVPAFKHPCHDCLAGRFTAKPRTQPAERPTSALELIYADLTGPYTPGIAKSTMCLNVIDAYTGYGISTPLKDKKEACDALIDSIKRLQMLGHAKVRELRADNDDPVFHSKRLTDWLSDHLINLSHSAPYIHKQVGVVERYNRTVGEITRSLLSHSGRSKYLWPEAMMHACYLYNRRPSTHHHLTHYEVLTGRKPDLSNLVTWGCEAYVHVPKEQQASKLDARCYQGIFVGVDEFSLAYRICTRNRIVTRQDVIFDESKFGTSYAQDIESDSRDMLLDEPSGEGEQPAVPHPKPLHKPPVQVMSPAQSVINARKRKQNPIMFSAALPPIIEHPFPVFVSGKPLPLPADYNEAVTCMYSYHWIKAIESEIQSLQDNHVYTVETPSLTKQHLITTKWVFAWKLDNNNNVIKAKARLVAKGFQQRPGEEFLDVYSPTVSHTTVRAVLSLVASENLYCHQIDFQTAFLNGPLDVPIFLKPPDGYGDGNSIWLLHRSLYGLKQAPRMWHLKLNTELNKLGFVESLEDESLFLRDEPDGTRTLLTVHVDDMLIVNKSKSIALQVVHDLQSVCKFKITDCGEVSRYLKIDICRNSKREVILHQSTYASEIVNKYLLHGDKHLAQIPLPANCVMCALNSDKAKTAEQKTPADAKLYASIVGSIMYLSNFTRPDLTYSVNQLCRYMSKPSQHHLSMAYHLLSYINYTLDYGITYSTTSHKLMGYCDASWLSCVDTSRSNTGFVFMLNNGPISWQSKLQPTVALSTAEAEYLSMGSSGREGVWLQRLVVNDMLNVCDHDALQCHMSDQLQYTVQSDKRNHSAISISPVILSDSQSALAMVKSNTSSKKTKHIEKLHHWVRERVGDGALSFDFISGINNVADIFTKPLPAPRFLFLRQKLGMMSLTDFMQFGIRGVMS